MIGLFLFAGVALSVVLFLYSVAVLIAALIDAMNAFVKRHSNTQKDDSRKVADGARATVSHNKILVKQITSYKKGDKSRKVYELSGSTAKRWMNCTASAILDYEGEASSPSDAMFRGIAIHAMAEDMLYEMFQEQFKPRHIVPRPGTNRNDKNIKYQNYLKSLSSSERREHSVFAGAYVKCIRQCVLDILANFHPIGKDKQLFKYGDVSVFNPEVNGTSLGIVSIDVPYRVLESESGDKIPYGDFGLTPDLILTFDGTCGTDIIQPNVIRVLFDLKTGKWQIYPDKSEQLMLYAAFSKQMLHSFGVNAIHMTFSGIFQENPESDQYETRIVCIPDSQQLKDIQFAVLRIKEELEGGVLEEGGILEHRESGNVYFKQDYISTLEQPGNYCRFCPRQSYCAAHQGA